jgi:short-subunit dehydrogenase
LGTYLASALAAAGVDLLLVAYPGTGLEAVNRSVSGFGVRSRVLVADLRERTERLRVQTVALAEFGRVDLLINNAGVEFSRPYHELTCEQILDVFKVNLGAPMLLTHDVLPGMLERRCGHIVNLSSLAGKSGAAFQEPYAATKAGLTAFTFSLRSTYRGTGVSASSVCPGFVEAGIYTRLKQQTGRSAPRLLGAVRPEQVAAAMLRAIRRDVPEIILNRYPVRPLLALMALSPRLGLWLTRKLGVNEFFHSAATAQAAALVHPHPKPVNCVA